MEEESILYVKVYCTGTIYLLAEVQGMWLFLYMVQRDMYRQFVTFASCWESQVSKIAGKGKHFLKFR